MRSLRGVVGFLSSIIVVSLLTPAAAQPAAPEPSVSAQLVFNADCTVATVQMSWTNWRTTAVSISVQDASFTNVVTPSFLEAGRDSGGLKASRNGGWSARFNGSWADQPVRGFAEAFNRKGGIIGRTNLATCVTTA